MRIFHVLGILFYATVLILIGLVLLIFSLNLLPPRDISNLLVYLQDSFNTRLIVGLSGVLLILISFSFAQLILGKFQREKTIAFHTASGEVTIALSAVEDLIKRIVVFIPEIKELRPDVVASKRGIVVDLRVILRGEANLPELTGRLQEITKAKIQEVLGIEEEVIIKIHIAKIISSEEGQRRKKETEGVEAPAIPFGGYGRV